MGTLIHGLLEHAMRHEGATREDLARPAQWLTVGTPDLRAFIPEALDLVAAVSKAPFWQEARAGADVLVEVPFAVRVEAGASIAVLCRDPAVRGNGSDPEQTSRPVHPVPNGRESWK